MCLRLGDFLSGSCRWSWVREASRAKEKEGIWRNVGGYTTGTAKPCVGWMLSGDGYTDRFRTVRLVIFLPSSGHAVGHGTLNERCFDDRKSRHLQSRVSGAADFRLASRNPTWWVDSISRRGLFFARKESGFRRRDQARADREADFRQGSPIGSWAAGHAPQLSCRPRPGLAVACSPRPCGSPRSATPAE